MDDLATIAIDAAGTRIGGWMSGLNGMQFVSLQAKLDYRAGGEEILLKLQTSLDQGETAIDVAAIKFGKESSVQLANIATSNSRLPFSPKELLPGQISDGVLGDRLRWIIVTKGVYTGTSLKVHVAVR